MQQKKLTPLDILQKQKAGLQVKSDELSDAIESRARYVQQNFIPLLRNNVVESAVSKMPPSFQKFAGSLLLKEKKTETHSSPLHTISQIAQGIALSAAGIAPFFLKGKKGAFISALLNQALRWMT